MRVAFRCQGRVLNSILSRSLSLSAVCVSRFSLFFQSRSLSKIDVCAYARAANRCFQVNNMLQLVCCDGILFFFLPFFGCLCGRVSVMWFDWENIEFKRIINASRKLWSWDYWCIFPRSGICHTVCILPFCRNIYTIVLKSPTILNGAHDEQIRQKAAN